MSEEKNTNVLKGPAKEERGVNFIGLYLDEDRSDLDELGTVGKPSDPRRDIGR